MIDEFLAKHLSDDNLRIAWSDQPGPEVMFHGHCHQKALIGMKHSMALFADAGCTASESGAGCCGMAGSFGYETEHYDVSRLIGEERLFPKVEETSKDAVIAIAGVSCRQQIEHFTGRETRHFVEVLADRIAPDHVWSPAQAEPVDVEPESIETMTKTRPELGVP
jgi:Fe-S oxidoreductase